MIAPLLVFGWGNLSRGDDALGPLFVNTLREQLPPSLAKQVDFLDDYQLQIEHALDLVGRTQVLFVDVSLTAAAPFEVHTLQAAPDESISTHSLSPQALMQVYQDVQGQPPPTCLMLEIRGDSFELGEPPSATAQQHLAAALAWVLNALQEGNGETLALSAAPELTESHSVSLTLGARALRRRVCCFLPRCPRLFEVLSMPELNDSLLSRIRPDVQAMHSYVVQDAQGMVKLDAMENPHRMSLELQQQLGQRLGAVALNRYPGQRISDLKRALQRHVALPDGFALMLGNGSDELISLLALACAVPVQPGQAKATVLAPEPGFVMYAMSAQLQGLAYVGVPLTADFELDAAAMVRAIAQHRPAITYLAYPNNPSANLWSDVAMDAVIEAVGAQGGLVVIDEAYQPFAAKSYVGCLARWKHVLLLRTLSKFGLAGVRLGYLIGPQALVAQIDKVRPPYNVSVLNAEAALFALEHQDVFEAQAQDIKAQRALLLEALAKLPGVQVFPSQANMILMRVADAPKTFDGLCARSVLVKNVSKMHPLLANCLRLTVGTADENRQLLAALKASV